MFKRFFAGSGWAIAWVGASGLLVMAFLLLLRGSPTVSSEVNASTMQTSSQPSPSPELGPRHQLTYEQWVKLLGREARVMAAQKPERLVVLAGDSLSLWFPMELLPKEVTWLNQGISGETTYGLLRRLHLFDATQPEVVLVLVGINDLIRGVREETLVENQREIVRHLKLAHPEARIVMQSILPHAGDRLLPLVGDRSLPRWVSRLAVMPNEHIRKLNQRLALVAKEEAVEYLDLHSCFTDAMGNLAANLSTDGLHLSPAGYQVWRSQLQQVLAPVPSQHSAK